MRIVQKNKFIDLTEYSKIIIERMSQAKYDHYEDKIAICKDRIDTWKETDQLLRNLIHELEGTYIDELLKVNIDDNNILHIEYTAGYDSENGASRYLVCPASYLFLSLAEAKSDWDDMWKKISDAQNEREREAKRNERYQLFLKLKEEFE